MSAEERRMYELQRKLQEEREAELRKMAILRKVLTPEARQRLTNLKMVRPEFASQIELQLINLAMSGKIELPIDDEQLKAILMKFQSNRRRTKIKRV